MCAIMSGKELKLDKQELCNVLPIALITSLATTMAAAVREKQSRSVIAMLSFLCLSPAPLSLCSGSN